ncbi:bacterioferritin [Thiomicrorhabdus sediminis]|uniref:Bacterioferritin n=1 Tax=Thiomicrorhabdus sediminis TaxID=2580412 RepID=A0A4V1HHU9_9GAMM|nr:bacterioferritin [Thiomicrorhabdus sediminis]QCU90283.1 bacterioferritin [Thiomicrorhabdus sediminis]
MSKKSTLSNLQKALSMELTAAHQYQLHASVLSDWGIDILSEQMRKEMSEELGHSDAFMERIMFLKGKPVLKMANTPVMAESLVQMFKTDLADEKEAIKFYTKAAQQAAEEGDIGTRTLFEKIVMDEEGHMSWLELQLDLIKRMGEPAYIAKHMSAINNH